MTNRVKSLNSCKKYNNNIKKNVRQKNWETEDMEWLWTWKVKSFGYRRNDELRTQDGRHVGKFHGDEIYGPDGKYIGEVKNGRLITHKSKKSRKKSPFTPKAKLVGQVGVSDMSC